jgi:hypothetical protein
MDPTRRRFHQRVGARAISNGGILGKDMIVITGSIRWTGNLPDWADMAARGVAAVAHGARGMKDRIFSRRV